MFNFMKKGGGSGNSAEREKLDREEKERRKREKKLRKEAKNLLGPTGTVSGNMSSEELLRLDEVRKSLKIRGRRKEKEKLPSGITADYSAEFFAALDIDRSTLASGDESVCCSSVTSTNEQDRSNDEIMATVNTIIDYCATQRNFGSANNAVNSLKYRSLPQVPPKPPKRGILKGSRSNIANIHEELIISTPDPQMLLMRNTMQNELLYESGAGSSVCTLASMGSSISPRGTSFTSVDSLRSDESLNRPIPHSPLSNLHILTSPSPSAESLTDTTNSSFATPLFSLSPIGESQGCDRWARVHSFEDIHLPLPPIVLTQLPPPRKLTIQRQKSPRQDFGFSLRKAICFDRTKSLLKPAFRPVIFAEPGASGCGAGLLPGDRLLKVNGIDVCDLSRENIIEMIRNSGENVTVEVQPVFELIELSRRCISPEDNHNSSDGIGCSAKVNCSTLKRSASKRFKRQVENVNEIYNGIPNPSLPDDLVWLVHRGGFCAAVRLPQQKVHLDGHKVIVQLLHNGEKLTVDEDDIEKQNPSSMDLVEDICELKHLNESSVLHCIRQRFGSNLIHTKAGPILIVVNPMVPLSLYSEKVVSMFRGCKSEDMPPHIYSLAQTAYRTMLETRRDQSLVFMGRSGSGKTTNFKHALYFLALVAGSCNNLFTAEKVNAVNTILEAFGNTKTCLNTNATRFTQILSLDFDQTGQIASASVQVLLLERQRAGKRHTFSEHNFLIMTRLVAGAEGLLQKELHLDNISLEDNHPFVSLPQKLEERHRAAADFIRTIKAFETLNIDQKAVRGIWNILASIYHLGLAGIVKSGSLTGARYQFANANEARKASVLLGVSMDDLIAAIFNVVSSSSSSSPLKSPAIDTIEAAWDSLDGLVIGLYAEAMAAVVALINKVICTSAHAISSILLLDTPGFQNPASCGGVHIGASLADFCHNYLQERLQLLFHHNTLVAPRDRYAQELIEISTEGVSESNPGSMISLIDKAPQNHVRTSLRDLRDQDRRGIIWLLDEESIYPNSNDDAFLERLFSYYGDREYQNLIRKCAAPKQFVLHHLQGTNPVLYNIEGWVRHSREHTSILNAAELLQESSKDEITGLYMNALLKSTGGLVLCGSTFTLDGSQSLRRISSIRRSFSTAGAKRHSVLLQMKFIVDGIIDTLRRTGIHFVQCFLLQHNAGLYSATSSNTGSPNATLSFNGSNEGDIINIPLLRSQLRGSQIIEAARLHRMGFPESVPISEFVRRFSLLTGDTAIGKVTNFEDILTANEIDPATYRVGPTQIFFRFGILCELEAKREVLLSDRIIQFQAHCRGYLARKQLSRRRVQELAVRCIQRNVKAFLAVRDWPWWRLLVRVTPLLNVHRTEEQLKIANEDLIYLRAKLEKVENERNLLKTDNQKLEAKLSEMTIDFTEERSAANINAEHLEAETSERLKLEKELADQQNKVKSLQETTEKLEMELICARSDLNGVSEDDENDSEEGAMNAVYKLKYERAARELEFTKRRLQTQHEHDLEQLVGLKKQLEKKLSDAYEEVEEQRQVVGQWKRKTQKMTNEMNDLRMMLEEQNVRNNVLEKKQRKFDVECQALQDTARQERQAKDRLSREMDVLLAEKFVLEQSLADTRLDLDIKEEHLASVKRELEEMTFGVGTEEEIAQLRRSKNELDRRVKEQEEELDEMAGQVQLLEQAKLRLEMALETMRKEARRENQQRDEELEEARGSAYKKIKALECQLETEHEERTLLLREKHELERRIAAAEDQERTDKQAEEIVNQKLRRDVRKYKALLKDSQTQLERLKTDTPGKTILRQLRNQLEDTESARILAVKARQAADIELAELQSMLEEANRGRNEAEDRALMAQRERAELQAHIEENEEELAELMKKYSSTVKQLNTEQIAASEYEFKLAELEAERNSLKDQVTELQQRLENVESLSDPSTTITSKRLELRSKELESRLELEQATRTRLEVQVTRHKEALEKLQQETTQAKVHEKQAQEQLKKSQKALRDLREELHSITCREQESIVRRKDLEQKLEQAECDSTSLRNDLRLALQRIADLQQAMEEEVDDGTISESDDSFNSEAGSMIDLEERLRPVSVTGDGTNPTTPTTSTVETTNNSNIKLFTHEKDDTTPRTPSSVNDIQKTLVTGKYSATTVMPCNRSPTSKSENINGDTSCA